MLLEEQKKEAPLVEDTSCASWALKGGIQDFNVSEARPIVNPVVLLRGGFTSRESLTAFQHAWNRASGLEHSWTCLGGPSGSTSETTPHQD